PLVLVDSLDVDVEDGSGIDLHLVLVLQILCHTHLVLLLHFSDIIKELRIVLERIQLLQLVQIRDPRVTDSFTDNISESGIGEKQPSPRSDSISLVLELAGVELVEVAE
ncbi:hypothetical protein PMAYCL1PPCAC_16476, partial [Pristionchus mayeri]